MIEANITGLVAAVAEQLWLIGSGFGGGPAGSCSATTIRRTPVRARPTTPSRARLVSAGHVLGIPLVAHVVAEPGIVHDIVGERSWSRREIALPVNSTARQ